MVSSTSRTDQKAQFVDQFTQALSEVGTPIDQSTLERTWDYLEQNQDVHIHFGDDTSNNAWQDMAQSSVASTAKTDTKMVRIATQDRDGGFAYVCLGDKAARELIQSLEQSLGGLSR